MICLLLSGILFKMQMHHFNYRDLAIQCCWLSTMYAITEHCCYYLVESSSTSEDNVRIVHLNSSLSKPHQIGANPYGSASDLEDQTILSKSTRFHLFTSATPSVLPSSW